MLPLTGTLSAHQAHPLTLHDRAHERGPQLPNYGKRGEPLTAYERSRLRATVDAGALERYLAACDDTERRAAIAYFAREMLVEDLVILDPGLKDAVEAGLLSENGRHLASNASMDLDVTPSDADRKALWKAIEVRAR